MKDTVKILLYVLLVLLVAAIVYMIYKRSNAPAEDVLPAAEMADSLFMDQQHAAGSALTAEDSMILDLTGQLPSQVGAPAESNANAAAPQSGATVDYTQSNAKPESQAAVNTDPKAQKVAEKTIALESKSKAEEKPKVNKVAKPTTSKPAASKPALSKSEASKPKGSSGGFFVVSGSFIKAENADDQVKKLKKMGYSGAMRKVFGSSEYYSAIAGSYSTRAEAEKIVSKLEAKGEKAFLKAK
ncbi:MAG: SPOR domain-containing protein [Saprospiraceae bacterium]|nr:SPOR domain-containing protein [Saprospiraceae bacterium]